MTVIGVGTVFVSLVTLVVVVTWMGRLLAEGGPPAAATPATETGAEASPEAPPAPEDLRAVALVAYSFHRQRQDRARPSVTSSPWSTAGLLRQVGRFHQR